MSNARQSVQAAYEAGADDIGVQNLDIAREYLERAERELELRHFRRARHEAMLAKNEAIKAHNVSRAIKAAQAAIDDSASNAPAIEEARSLLAEAREAAAQGRDRRALRLAEESERKAKGAVPPD